MAKRGENIHKRKDGRWEGRYIKSRTPELRWGYLYGHSYSDVKQALIQKKAETGFYRLTGTDLVFSELAESWLRSLKSGVKESTYAHYQYTLHRYILPVLGDCAVVSLDEEILERSIQQVICGAGSKHKALGYSSAKECLTMVRRICRHAAHLRLIRPMELQVCLPQKNVCPTKPLSLSEQRQLRDYVLEAPTPRKLGLLLGIEAGLRIGEICGLKWSDFDLNSGTIQINRTVSRISCGNGHTKVVVQTPKTSASCREVPITKQMLSALKKISRSFDPDAWFLSGCTSKPVEPRCYRKSLKVYLKQAKIRPVHPHTLRHTFATTCLQAGCDIKTLSDLLGHANPSVTLQRYVHSDLTRKRREIRRTFRENEQSVKRQI